MVEAIGIGAAVAVGAWIFGGVVLRALGWILGVIGIAVLAISADPAGALAFFAGLAAWLAGQWHFAMRHRAWKSPLAHDAVAAAPLVPDPADSWRPNARD
jgi:hypothetical protein